MQLKSLHVSSVPYMKNLRRVSYSPIPVYTNQYLNMEIFYGIPLTEPLLNSNAVELVQNHVVKIIENVEGRYDVTKT